METRKPLKQIRSLSLAQRGFTLIELIVVVAIIGVLIAIIAPTTRGSKEEAVANQIVKTSNAIIDNLKLISVACGYKFDGEGSGYTDSVAKLMTQGASGLYDPDKDLSCYKSSGAGVIDGIQFDPDDEASMLIAGYRAFPGGPAIPGHPAYVGFVDLPDSLILKIVNKFDKVDSLDPAGYDVNPSAPETWSRPYGYTEIDLATQTRLFRLTFR